MVVTAPRLSLVLSLALGILACGDPGGVEVQVPPGFDHDPNAWTLVVLPDTQYYSEQHPDLFDEQTAFISQYADTLRIRMVVHVGDLVNFGDNRNQWDNARASLDLLDERIPFMLAPGNHDYDDYDDGRVTLMNEYLPPEWFQAMDTFGGFFEPGRGENSYHLLRAGGQDWLLLALEFGPRPAVLDWARDVLDAHPDHRAIVVTHAYLYFGGRYDWAEHGEMQMWNPYVYDRIYGVPGQVSDGAEMWREVVQPSGNTRLVLCGHVALNAWDRATDKNRGGHDVHQLLANYQSQQLGGAAELRLLHFYPATGRIRVRTYSPHLRRYRLDEANDFFLRYD